MDNGTVVYASRSFHCCRMMYVFKLLLCVNSIQHPLVYTETVDIELFALVEYTVCSGMHRTKLTG